MNFIYFSLSFVFFFFFFHQLENGPRRSGFNQVQSSDHLVRHVFNASVTYVLRSVLHRIMYTVGKTVTHPTYKTDHPSTSLFELNIPVVYLDCKVGLGLSHHRINVHQCLCCLSFSVCSLINIHSSSHNNINNQS